MRLPSRRSFAEARIKLGSFDRFLLLYGTMFAAFGVASPFLPALLHQRGLGPSEIGAVLAAGTAVRLITGPVTSRLADRLSKHQQILTVFLVMAAVVAFGYDLPAGFAIFLIVSVAHASTLVPIVPIADAMTLAAAPGRFQYGWVRGGASAAFIVGSVSAGQVVQATSFSGIVWMNGTLLALAAVAALWLPRNALDRPLAPRQANIRALFAAPGFLPLMALAALVMSSHALQALAGAISHHANNFLSSCQQLYGWALSTGATTLGERELKLRSVLLSPPTCPLALRAWCDTAVFFCR